MLVCIGGMFTAAGNDLENIQDNKDYIHNFAGSLMAT